MRKSPRIVVTEEDYVRLRRLASHPDLATELGTADIVDASAVAPDVVTMNSRVLYVDETSGDRREVTVVYPQESDPAARKVSILAPVGTALLGLAAGQSILWPFPDGTSHTLRVLRVVYQPEASADRSEPPRRTATRRR
jgi:regulator of nucleoside diphosphate kinase